MEYINLFVYMNKLPDFNLVRITGKMHKLHFIYNSAVCSIRARKLAVKI